MTNHFISHNKVRMHDTDMAGIIFFANQFRFAHDAWEELMADMDLHFDHLFTKKDFAFVIVHAEADYFSPLKAGDALEVHVFVDRIGNTSFTIGYEIYKAEKLVGTVKTVHVTINRESHTKIPIPETLRTSLKKYAALRS